VERLPIDDVLAEIGDALARSPSVVAEAPPGAGKTTRVPPYLLAEGIAGNREIWVLEPRRLAVRMAARRVASERGERVGETIGYQVRFDEVAGARTRVRYVTEGILTRRLVADPALERAGAVVLDEFHERHVETDLALALLRRLQRERRPDLKIVVMSATLDAEPVAAFLGDSPRVRSEGRRFEVAVEHLPHHDPRPLEEQVTSALRRVVEEEADGDILVFLPGAAEIRRAMAASEPLAARANLLLLALHGDLPADEQERAVRPADRRKVVFATNVAESSVTIEGVTTVVDSGLARFASHSPWSGLARLEVARVSRASAIQRAGRAGRARSGRALRLYTYQDFMARDEFETPEILRADLAEPLLELHAAGVADARQFEWFEPPDASAIDAAESLLVRLGAIDTRGRVTETGRRMIRFPLHPRVARLVVEAERRGAGREGALVAALVSERDIRERRFEDRVARVARSHSPSDLLELADLFAEAAALDFDPRRLGGIGVDARAARSVERVRRQIERVVEKAGETSSDGASDDDLLVAILAGFPDRVARRRGRGDERIELTLASGGSAELAPESVVRASDFLVAVDAEERRDAARAGRERRAGTIVRLASAIEPEWLLDLFPGEVRETREARWNATDERAEAVSRLVYGEVVLDESRSAPGEEGSRLLAEAARAAGVARFTDEAAVERFLARVATLAEFAPELGIRDLPASAPLDALEALADGRSSFAELREAAGRGGLVDVMRGRFSHDESRTLAREAPERVGLARGREVRVEYERGKPPWIASRIQDFFGMRDGPRIASGRIPLVLHLLAPSNRPVQVTSDLAGFWERHYPSIRRELGRRYPKHAWPEDPTAPKR
jgi:ATP-dependent helicase HrpB